MTETISPREAEIISLRELGLNNRDIAGSLGLKLGTVKIYVSRLIRKGIIQPKPPMLNYWDYHKLDDLLSQLEHTIKIEGGTGTTSIDAVTQSLRACRCNYQKEFTQ